MINKMNPLMCNISYVSYLANKINGKDTISLKPNNGGKQFSIRIDDFLSMQIDEISKLSGWSKTDIISAFIRRGLYEFYDLLSEDKTKEILINLPLPTHGILLEKESLGKTSNEV